VTNLAGRVALVTGASRGIGAATAQRLASDGARVIRVARSLEAGSRDGYDDIPCDLTDSGQVERLAREVSDRFGVPGIVVSNAGGFFLKPLEQTSPADFDRQIAENLRSAFLVAGAFLPAMRAAKGGHYVSVGSVADHVGYPENAAYAASKYGMRGLHETLVAEFRGSGVLLTLVSPGPVDTPIWDPIHPERREGFPARSDMLRPSDVADAIHFVVTRPPHVHFDWLRLGPA
jgi:NAD(P)-dependent dehydrogenase (short-subunit alcohol dehydrogenase family)